VKAVAEAAVLEEVPEAILEAVPEAILGAVPEAIPRRAM
jgi:hypothetical protein